MADQLVPMWEQVVTHIAIANRLARRSVEEAWRAGDLLAQIKEQTPHGSWLPSLEEHGIPARSARRLIQLRQMYAEIGQIGRFQTVSGALTSGKSVSSAAIKSDNAPLYIINAADLWDWHRDLPTPLAHRLLTDVELNTFVYAMNKALPSLWEDEDALAHFREALACIVDFGPLENNDAAQAETERRISEFSAGKLLSKET